jgi:transcriptional regulator with XRE-family HTH domain
VPLDGHLDDPSHVPQLLRDERLRQGLTLEWIADRVGVKAQSIHEFETGKKRPADDSLRKWVRSLKAPDEWANDWALWLTAEAMVRAGRVRLRERLTSAELQQLTRSTYLTLRGLRR